MSRNAKILLILAIVCLGVGGAFNAGLINPRGLDALYTIFPLGAVLFGMFLIVLLLQKQGEDPEKEQATSPGPEATSNHPLP